MTNSTLKPTLEEAVSVIKSFVEQHRTHYGLDGAWDECIRKGEMFLKRVCSPDGMERDDERLPIIPPLPEAPPTPIDGAVAVCGLCGLRIGRVMGYVCHNVRCGVFPRVTC